MSTKTEDSDKRRLLEASDHHKRELEKEVRALSDKTEKMLINGLIIGGSLVLTYFVVSQWGKSKAKKKKAKAAEIAETESDDVSSAPSMISQIGNKVINQASLILLDIAKEKIMEYLESRKKRDENS